jgi:hypothetical protein
MLETATSSPESRALRSGTESVAHYPLTKRFRRGWIIEVFVIGAAGILHDFLRNALMGPAAVALENAKGLTAVERWMGIYHEHAVQQFFLNWPFVVGMWNFYYDSAHFLVPIAVAVYLYKKWPGRYTRMRNTFLIMLFVTAPICWAALPITPPKFMPARYGFVDTQVVYWNIGPQKPMKYGPDGEPSPEVIKFTGNIYGGMPSHHVSWSLWCVIALWPTIRRRRLRPLLLIYPLLTLGAITVTGNHRFLDFAGSMVEVTVAYLLAIAIERGLDRRRARRARAAEARVDTASPETLEAVSESELVP